MYFIFLIGSITLIHFNHVLCGSQYDNQKKGLKAVIGRDSEPHTRTRKDNSG